MNYAQKIDRLPIGEQEALARLFCNLFETGSASEWLLYISEWDAPGGGIPLVPQEGEVVHMPKSYEPYSPEPDDAYYLGLCKWDMLNAKWDMLGDAFNSCASKMPTTGLCLGEERSSRRRRRVP